LGELHDGFDVMAFVDADDDGAFATEVGEEGFVLEVKLGGGARPFVGVSVAGVSAAGLEAAAERAFMYSEASMRAWRSWVISPMRVEG
jgi:hypothetical protein